MIIIMDWFSQVELSIILADSLHWLSETRAHGLAPEDDNVQVYIDGDNNDDDDVVGG